MTTPPNSTPSTPFNSLTPPQQRVSIAKDVLRQLDSARIIAEHGSFLRLPNGTESGVASLRETIAAQQSPCLVCALGSLLVAQVDVNGDCQLDEFEVRLAARGRGTHVSVMDCDSGYDNVFSPYILKHFEPDQLQLIEVAFEGGGGAFSVRDGVECWREDGDNEEYQTRASGSECSLTVEQADKAMAFGALYREPDARLRAIMANLIAHDGTFTP